MHNHSYENEFNLHVNEISFSYERMSTKTRFEKEAKGYSEMAYCLASTLDKIVMQMRKINREKGYSRETHGITASKPTGELAVNA